MVKRIKDELSRDKRDHERARKQPPDVFLRDEGNRDNGTDKFDRRVKHPSLDELDGANRDD